MVVLITGAAGNLGSLLARHLLTSGHELRLMYHRTPLAADLVAAPNVRAVKADLADPSTLPAAVEGVNVIVHFAGRLFAPRPERFLRETNTRWFSNLVTAAIDAGVNRIILTSFPHVEGPTSVEQPATGRSRSRAHLGSCRHATRGRASVVRAHGEHVNDTRWCFGWAPCMGAAS